MIIKRQAIVAEHYRDEHEARKLEFIMFAYFSFMLLVLPRLSIDGLCNDNQSRLFVSLFL